MTVSATTNYRSKPEVSGILDSDVGRVNVNEVQQLSAITYAIKVFSDSFLKRISRIRRTKYLVSRATAYVYLLVDSVVSVSLNIYVVRPLMLKNSARLRDCADILIHLVTHHTLGIKLHPAAQEWIWCVGVRSIVKVTLMIGTYIERQFFQPIDTTSSLAGALGSIPMICVPVMHLTLMTLWAPIGQWTGLLLHRVAKDAFLAAFLRREPTLEPSWLRLAIKKGMDSEGGLNLGFKIATFILTLFWPTFIGLVVVSSVVEVVLWYIVAVVEALCLIGDKVLDALPVPCSHPTIG